MRDYGKFKTMVDFNGERDVDGKKEYLVRFSYPSGDEKFDWMRVDDLKSVYGARFDEEVARFCEWQVENQGFFSVEKIEDVRYVANGMREFCVKWAGIDELSWVTEQDCKCDDLIEEWEKERKEKLARDKKKFCNKGKQPKTKYLSVKRLIK